MSAPAKFSVRFFLMQIRHMLTLLPTFALGGLVPACFTSELDPDAPNSFACCSDEDCPGDQQCVARVCSFDRLGVDPSIGEMQCPEDVAVLGPNSCPTGDDDTFQIRFPVDRGDGRDVTIVATLDGEPLTVDQTNGTVSPVARPTEPGAHRIHVELQDSDGNRLGNPGATVDTIFWIDSFFPDPDNPDEQKAEEHLAIASPVPGTVLRPGEIVEFEFVSRNFAFKNPTCEASLTGTGHTHLYADFDLEECYRLEAPNCFSDWFENSEPTLDEFPCPNDPAEGVSVYTREVRLPDLSPGPHTISALGESFMHTGYTRESAGLEPGAICSGPDGNCLIDSVTINVVADECTGEI